MWNPRMFPPAEAEGSVLYCSAGSSSAWGASVGTDQSLGLQNIFTNFIRTPYLFFVCVSDVQCCVIRGGHLLLVELCKANIKQEEI
jgi:hypothetical protein